MDTALGKDPKKIDLVVIGWVAFSILAIQTGMNANKPSFGNEAVLILHCATYLIPLVIFICSFLLEITEKHKK